MAENGFQSNGSNSQEHEQRNLQEENGKNVLESTEFSFSTEPTLEKIRQMQAHFAAERGWGKYHTPRNLFLAMTGEVGEVAELMQWKGEVQEGLPDWTDEDREKLANELSDVLIYLVRLSEKCHIDLPSAAVRKIGLNHKKYPADKVYGSSKKYTEYKD